MTSTHLTEQQAPPEPELRARLIDIVRNSAWLMSALSAVHDLGLDFWCIGAGAVRNLVWDNLHGFDLPSSLPDVDVAYFDPSATTSERDAELQRTLTQALPGVPWEVTNQAYVHHWFEGHFGYPVAPLHSLEEAIASWPEYATSVGVSLRADNVVEIIAPHGLQDLFSLTIRHNPIRASAYTFRQRVAQKRYAERWPMVMVVPC